MYTFESKQTVFQGTLRPSSRSVVAPGMEPAISEERQGKPARYWVLSQSHLDLRDPENSPSVSMWGFLLASAQTQRMNEISVYVEHGTSSEEIRLLYLNDFALAIWSEMKKPIKIKGRLQRPPRAALLSFGMPFSE